MLVGADAKRYTEQYARSVFNDWVALLFSEDRPMTCLVVLCLALQPSSQPADTAMPEVLIKAFEQRTRPGTMFLRYRVSEKYRNRPATVELMESRFVGDSEYLVEYGDEDGVREHSRDPKTGRPLLGETGDCLPARTIIDREANQLWLHNDGQVILVQQNGTRTRPRDDVRTYGLLPRTPQFDTPAEALEKLRKAENRWEVREENGLQQVVAESAGKGNDERRVITEWVIDPKKDFAITKVTATIVYPGGRRELVLEVNNEYQFVDRVWWPRKCECSGPSTKSGDALPNSMPYCPGQRVQKLLCRFNWGGWGMSPVTDRRFLYDGWNVIMDVDGLPPTGQRVNRYYTCGLGLGGQNGKPRPEPPAAGPRSGLADAASGLARGAFAELDGVCESGADGCGTGGVGAQRAARCAVRRGLMAEANRRAPEVGVEPARPVAPAEGEKGKKVSLTPFSAPSAKVCSRATHPLAWGALIAALLIAQHSSVCQGLLACDPPTCVGGSDRGVTLPHGRWVHDQGA